MSMFTGLSISHFEIACPFVDSGISPPEDVEKGRLFRRNRAAAPETPLLAWVRGGLNPASTLKSKAQPRSGETGMFFMPPEGFRAGRFVGGWRDNAVRRRTARRPDSPSSHPRDT
jgi:hypothetical protein